MQQPDDARPIEGHQGPPAQEAHPPGVSATGLLILALWLGLVAGFSELISFWLFRARLGEVWVYIGKFRHFPWTVPLINAAALVAIAVPMAALTAIRPAIGNRIGPFLLVAFALIPPIMVPAPSIYLSALVLFTMGLASIIVPIARRNAALIASIVRFTLPTMLLVIVGLAVWTNSRGLTGQPASPPPPGQPNVLLVVLDTVRLDRLSLPGIDRATDRETTPELADFSQRGVSFTQARAPAPWTLPTHATLMTGRWPFEASPGRYGAMIRDCPTLAEALGRRGYETAGFVANNFYCSYFTGIDRGFKHYEDIPVNLSSVLQATQIGSRVIDLIAWASNRWRPDQPPPIDHYFRVDAEFNNQRFFHWLDRSRDEDRPFFTFLNYFDAHDPYVVPQGARHRFGKEPAPGAEFQFLDDWWLSEDKTNTTPEQVQLLIDGYDSCLAYLDEQLGQLFRGLDQRGLLDETIVVITSDHGEAFGEHDLYGHGISLFEDQLRVPLIVVAPGIEPAGQIIDHPVSLRDLPATILDLAGESDAPLPGVSLSSFWRGDPSEAPAPSPSFASVDGPDYFNPNHGRSPVFGGPMVSLTNDRLLKYIRTGTTRAIEELYNLQSDPGEESNLASPLAGDLLDSFRNKISEISQEVGTPDQP